MDALFSKRGDLTAIAPVGNVDLRIAVDLSHEANAPRAQDAPVAVEHQRWPEVHVRPYSFPVENASREVHAALGWTEAVGEVLQWAFATLVAHRAIQRVIHE